jgi:DNA-binding transcriptional MerR regulator
VEAQWAIGELAKRTGYKTGMIRHFEKMGVISPPARSEARYRLFGPHHVEELCFVRQMQDLGFYVQQIKELRRIKLSDLPLDEKERAIQTVFEEHEKYVESRVAYFSSLKERINVVAPTFVETVLTYEC